MKHILFIIPSLEPGGAERVMVSLCNHFSKSYKVTLLTLSDGLDFYLLDPSVHRINLSFKNPFRLKRIFLKIKCLRSTVSSLQPDIVVSFLEYMNILTLLSCVFLKTKVIVSERTDPRFHKISWFLRLLRRLTYPCAYYVVVQTKPIASYFSSTKQTVIIPNPVSIQTNKLSYETFQRVISIGRLCPNKGFETLLKAMAFYPHLKLFIYGKGPDQRRLASLIQTLAIDAHLVGTTNDVFKALDDSDLFIFPSLYEGFPNALAEAMSIGMPIIASDIDGNKTMIQHDVNGLLFSVNDVTSLVGNIKIMEDNQTRIRLGRQAFLDSQKFYPNKIFSQWKNLFEK